MKVIKSRRVRWAGHSACIQNFRENVVANLGIYGRLYEQILERYGVRIWTGFNCFQGRVQWQALMNTVMNLWVLSKVGNFLTIQMTVRFSRRFLHHGVCPQLR
jgi:hypothetical protein